MIFSLRRTPNKPTVGTQVYNKQFLNVKYSDTKQFRTIMAYGWHAVNT